MEYVVYAMYVNYAKAHGGAVFSEAEFNSARFEASRRLDNAITGIDGVRKLQVAFPTEAYDANSVSQCMCAILDTMAQIRNIEKEAYKRQGYVETADGVHGKVISSMSAGNESVTYSTSAGESTITDKAAADMSVQEQLYKNIIYSYLRGARDKNGVNLLYMGEYPKGVL